MKKFYLLFLIIAISIVFTACSENDNSSSEKGWTVTFAGPQGATNIPQKITSVKDFTTISRPPDPVFAGRAFKGWFVTANGTGSDIGQTAFSFTTPITANLTLWAGFDDPPVSPPGYHIVSFNTYGGNYVGRLLVQTGKIIIRPPDPRRFGHTFEGWYADSDYTIPFDYNLEINDNTVVHARWESTDTEDNRTRITELRAYSTSDGVSLIRNPATGNYPQGLLKFPYNGPENTVTTSGGIDSTLRYTQTIEWTPAIAETFAANTVYTARFIFEPRVFSGSGARRLDTITLNDVTGLPSGAGVQSVTGEHVGEAFIVTVIYEITGAVKAQRQAIFEDNFAGTSLNTTKWGWSNQEPRHGFSFWRNDMVTVNNGLNVGFKIDPDAHVDIRDEGFGDNQIRAGAIQSTRLHVRDAGDTGRPGQPAEILFESSYGYFEASIRYPKGYGSADGYIPWGGFWLHSARTVRYSEFNYHGAWGTEIDILETLSNSYGGFNSALHWNGYYPGQHKSVGRYADGYPPGGNGPFTEVDIYDGNFHTFALCWSPARYRFYVDGLLFWEVHEGYTDYWSHEWRTVQICQNPNYLTLSVEGASWQNWPEGIWPAQWIEETGGEGKMEVQWVRVWNQPPH